MILLAALLALGPTADDPAPPPGTPLVFELRADAAPLADRGPARRFRFVADFEGTLHVFALATGADPFLRLEDAAGTPLAEDDDGGGGQTPYLERAVLPGDALTIVVAARIAGAGVPVELRLESSPETGLTRAAAAEAKAQRTAVESDPELSPEAARDAIRSILEPLLLVEGGAQSGDVAIELTALGLDAYRLGDFGSTVAAWSVVRGRAERVMAPDRPDLQRIRGNLGVAYEESGDLDQSFDLKERVYRVLIRTRPDDDPDLQIARLQLAVAHMHREEFDRALALQRPAVARLQERLPDTDPMLLSQRTALASTLRKLGDTDGARQMLEDVVTISIRALGPDHPDGLRARIELANVLAACGELDRARRLQEAALAACERQFPDDHVNVREARAGLAKILGVIGDLEGARALFERDLAELQAHLPEDDGRVIGARSDLAATLRELGDFEGARRLLEAALGSLEAQTGGSFRTLLVTRTQLAGTLLACGRADEARGLYEGVLSAWGERFGADDPDLQVIRLDSALALQRLGELERARDRVREVLGVRARTLPPGNPYLLVTHQSLAVIALELGDFDEACRQADALAEDIRRGVVSAVLTLSPREAEQLALTRAKAISPILWLAARVEDAPRRQRLHALAWSLIETVRSAASTSTRVVRASTVGAAALPIAGLRAEIAQAGREVARLAGDAAAGNRLLDAMRRQEDAEKRLRERLAGTLRFDPPTADAIAAALPADAAAVSFWTLSEHRAGPRADDERPARRMLAFVLRPGRAPVAIDLGPLAPIGSAVAAWRTAARTDGGRGVAPEVEADPPDPGGTSEDAAAAAGEALRRLVFDPLRSTLGDARRLMLVPDDVLHLVPLDALPAGADRDVLLGDRFTIEVRTALADLRESRPAVGGSGALVLAGGIDFDSSAGAVVFPPLPGTSGEIEAIAALRVETAGADAPIETLTGTDATKSRLAEIAPRARFLHLATHGAFSDAPAGSARGTGPDAGVRGLAPLTLCGLALSGANRAPDALGHRAGILTGEEIATLDLENCELAVLSACETKLGERRAGQGVASLETALSAAGARTTLTSLWRVPDEATRELMIEFYRRVWVEKEPKGRALWGAKRALRGKGAVLADWAGWVLTGTPE